ncbi:Histone-lysine N-methyltransferase 2E, partial [Trichinella murrelli]
LNMVNMNSLDGAHQLIPPVRAPDTVFSQKPGELLWRNEFHAYSNSQKSDNSKPIRSPKVLQKLPFSHLESTTAAKSLPAHIPTVTRLSSDGSAQVAFSDSTPKAFKAANVNLQKSATFAPCRLRTFPDSRAGLPFDSGVLSFPEVGSPSSFNLAEFFPNDSSSLISGFCKKLSSSSFGFPRTFPGIGRELKQPTAAEQPAGNVADFFKSNISEPLNKVHQQQHHHHQQQQQQQHHHQQQQQQQQQQRFTPILGDRFLPLLQMKSSNKMVPKAKPASPWGDLVKRSKCHSEGNSCANSFKRPADSAPDEERQSNIPVKVEKLETVESNNGDDDDGDLGENFFGEFQPRALEKPIEKPLRRNTISSGKSEPHWEGEDYTTRCFCGMTHNDEFMVQCDKCEVWQHCDCVGLEMSRIPENYLCELCDPRTLPLSLEEAKLMQMKKLKQRARNRTRKGSGGGGSWGCRGRPKKENDSAELSLDQWLDSLTDTQGAKKILDLLPSESLCKAMFVAVQTHGLVALKKISSGQPIAECILKPHLARDKQDILANGVVLSPWLLFQDLKVNGSTGPVDLCVDASDTDFAHLRRSCHPNSQIHTVVHNGQLRFVLVAAADISEMVEITIPFDYDYTKSSVPVTCSCFSIHPTLRSKPCLVDGFKKRAGSKGKLAQQHINDKEENKGKGKLNPASGGGKGCAAAKADVKKPTQRKAKREKLKLRWRFDTNLIRRSSVEEKDKSSVDSTTTVKNTGEVNADVDGRDVVGRGVGAADAEAVADDEAEPVTSSARSKPAAAAAFDEPNQQQQGRQKQRNESKAKRGSIELARLRKDYWYSRQVEETSGESGAGGVDWTLPNERTKTSTREERKMQSIMKYIQWMEEQEKKLQRKRGSQQVADRRPEKKRPRRRSLGDVALLNRTKQVEAAKPDDDRGADSAFDGGDLGESTKVVNILDNLHHPNSEHAKDSVGELIEKVVEQQADLMSNMNNDKHIFQQKTDLQIHREQCTSDNNNNNNNDNSKLNIVQQRFPWDKSLLLTAAAAALNSSKTTEEARQKMINIETLNQIGNNGYSRSELHADAAALPKRKLSLDEYKHRKQINEGDVSDNKEHNTPPPPPPPLPPPPSLLEKPKSFFPDMSYDMLKSLSLHFNNPVGGGVPTLPVERSTLPDLTTPVIPCGLETSDNLDLSANEDQDGTFEMETANASNTNFDQNRKDKYQDICNVQLVVLPMKSTGNNEEKKVSPSLSEEEHKMVDKNKLATIYRQFNEWKKSPMLLIDDVVPAKVSRQEQTTCSVDMSLVVNNNDSNGGYSCSVGKEKKATGASSTVVSAVVEQCASAADEGRGEDLDGNFELNEGECIERQQQSVRNCVPASPSFSDSVSFFNLLTCLCTSCCFFYTYYYYCCGVCGRCRRRILKKVQTLL